MNAPADQLRIPTAAMIGIVFAVGLLFAAGLAWSQSQPDDPFFHSAGSWSQDFDDQWSLKQMRVYVDAVRAESDEADGTERVIVAVIDTGMDYEHPDFAAQQLWHNSNEKRNGRDDDGNGYADDLIGWNFVSDNNNPWDLSGHGTHVSGLIAACTDNAVGISAINPDALIMPLKVANFVGQARSSAVAAAVYYAVDNGARVINLSLGSERVTELEKTAADYAVSNDVLIVVSAGNRGLSAQNNGYATLPGVLVVAASGLDGTRAGFSNFGEDVQVLAPGVDVLSLRARDTDFIGLSNPPDYSEGDAVVGADHDYYRASGTSFAAAQVSGLASKLLSLRPLLSASQVHRMLVQSTVDVGAVGVDQRSGYGRVDFVRTLAADPDHYITARLTGVELQLKDQQIWINLQGSAGSDQFSSAELAVRAAPGSVSIEEEDPKAKKRKKKSRKKKAENEPEPPSPYDWQILEPVSVPIENGLMGSVDLETLIAMTGGSNTWDVRLVVKDANGHSRESRMSMALPRPPAQEEVASE